MAFNFGSGFGVPQQPAFSQFQQAAAPASTFGVQSFGAAQPNAPAFGAQGVGRRFDQIYDANGRLSETEVAGFTDLFARVDYRFIGKGRIWIQGSNLLNNKYQYWNGYQVWGLTVMGGISLGLF